jgi:hypothetical protein
MLSPIEIRTVKQVRAAARAVVSLSAGLYAGASQLRGSIAMLPAALQMPHPAVSAFLAAYPSNLASGESRLYLPEPELLAVDARSAEIEALHRHPVIAESKALYFAYSQLLHSHSEPPAHEPSEA